MTVKRTDPFTTVIESTACYAPTVLSSTAKFYQDSEEKKLLKTSLYMHDNFSRHSNILESNIINSQGLERHRIERRVTAEDNISTKFCRSYRSLTGKLVVNGCIQASILKDTVFLRKVKDSGGDSDVF